jgi:hypothetical protein
MTLQEHFGNSGRCAKIPIDLEWWMGIEQVGINSSTLNINSIAGIAARLQ